jgi:hypothetical protein
MYLCSLSLLFVFTSPALAQSAETIETESNPKTLEAVTETVVAVDKNFLDYATDEQLTQFVKEANGDTPSCFFKNAFGPAGGYLGVVGNCQNPGALAFRTLLTSPNACTNGDSPACRKALQNRLRRLKENNAAQQAQCMSERELDDLNQKKAIEPSTEEVTALTQDLGARMGQAFDCISFCDIACSLDPLFDICFCGGQSFECPGTPDDECPQDPNLVIMP